MDSSFGTSYVFKYCFKDYVEDNHSLPESVVVAGVELSVVDFAQVLGEDVDEDTANALGDEIEAEYEDLEVEIQFGGQPIYYYVISVE